MMQQRGPRLFSRKRSAHRLQGNRSLAQLEVVFKTTVFRKPTFDSAHSTTHAQIRILSVV
jgi:hypothetical protein